MAAQPLEFAGVTLVAQANVYFDGKVVSHSFRLPDGTRKTAGLIFPGKFHFGTEQAERMQIVAGACAVKTAGQSEARLYAAGQQFDVAARSGFDVEVSSGLCQYVCSYLG